MTPMQQNIIECAIRNGVHRPGSVLETKLCMALLEKGFLVKNEEGLSFSPTQQAKFAFEGKQNTEKLFGLHAENDVPE